MMPGGQNKQSLGYTIVEVMVVLAVSGVMFLIAATFVNGKQASTSFSAGVHDMASSLQDVIEQVNDGRYSDVPFTCSPGSPPGFSGTVLPDQGTNSDCVFVGKFLYFSGNYSANYQVFTLAGNRQSGGQPAVTPNSVQPVPIYGPLIDLTIQQTVPQNLAVKNVVVKDANGNLVAPATLGLGFLQSLGTVDSTGSTYLSGAQTIGLYYEPNLSTPGLIESNVVTNMRVNAANIAPATSATICLTDGNPGTRYATVDVGLTDQNQFSVNSQILGNGSTC